MEVKKVFISQPMRGKTDEQILNERAEMITHISKLLGNCLFDIIDSFIPDSVQLTPLECLGESIKMLSEADYVYFGTGWENARGCIVEHETCVKYGLNIIKD